jgi:hypothetical protein
MLTTGYLKAKAGATMTTIWLRHAGNVMQTTVI